MRVTEELPGLVVEVLGVLEVLLGGSERASLVFWFGMVSSSSFMEFNISNSISRWDHYFARKVPLVLCELKG